jgi:hypothetical protein
MIAKCRLNPFASMTEFSLLHLRGSRVDQPTGRIDILIEMSRARLGSEAGAPN